MAFIVALSIISALLAPEAAEDLPAGSSLAKGPAGSAAAYLTLQDLGYVVSRSFEPVASLAVEPASTVLIVADPAQEASASDRRAVQSLASAGATVIVTGCRGASFLTEPREASSRDGAVREFPSLLMSPLTAGAPRIKMDSGCPRPELASRYLAIYGDADMAAVRLSRPGRGLIVWWASNTPMSNASIDAPGHLELLLNAVGAERRHVVWDEFYHGQHRSLYSYARQTPLPWLGVQVLLVTVVAAFMYVRRRAPIVELPAESRVSPLEFVDTMSDLYARVHAAGDAVSAARTRLRRLLVEATGIAPGAADDRLARAAAMRTGLNETELSRVLAASAAADAALDTDAALSLVRRLQECARAVTRERVTM